MNPHSTSKVLSGVIASLNDAIYTMASVELTQENHKPVLKTIDSLKSAVKELTFEVERLDIGVKDASTQASIPSPSRAPNVLHQSIPSSVYGKAVTSPGANEKPHRLITVIRAPKNNYLPLTPSNPVKAKAPVAYSPSSSPDILDVNPASGTEKTVFLPLTPTPGTKAIMAMDNAAASPPKSPTSLLHRSASITWYEDRQPSNSAYEYRTEIAIPYDQYDTDNFKADSYNALLFFPPRPHGWIHHERNQEELGGDDLQDGDSETEELEVDFTKSSGNGQDKDDTSSQDHDEKKTTECDK